MTGLGDHPAQPPESPGASVGVALAAAVIGFFALLLLGLGALSYFTQTDVIAVSGLGQIPGVIGVAVAVIIFAGGLWGHLKKFRPTYPPVFLIALGVGVGHLVAVWFTALVTGAGMVTATAAAGSLLAGGATWVITAAALVAGWSAVALRRTRSTLPQWPWEEDGGGPNAG